MGKAPPNTLPTEDLTELPTGDRGAHGDMRAAPDNSGQSEGRWHGRQRNLAPSHLAWSGQDPTPLYRPPSSGPLGTWCAAAPSKTGALQWGSGRETHHQIWAAGGRPGRRGRPPARPPARPPRPRACSGTSPSPSRRTAGALGCRGQRRAERGPDRATGSRPSVDSRAVKQRKQWCTPFIPRRTERPGHENCCFRPSGSPGSPGRDANN